MHTVDFKFAKDWRHAGVDYKAGDVAKLSPTKVAKLTKLGAGSAASAKTESFASPAHKT